MPYSSADPNAFIALAKQSALGTPNVTAAQLRFAKYLSGNNFDNVLEVVDLREGGDGLDRGYSYLKSHKVTGQIVLNARPEITGLILAGLIGAATHDGATAAPVAHTFHTGHASFPWFTMLAQHPGSAVPHLISDVRFTGLTVEAMAGEPLKLTAPFVALSPGASAAAVTPTYYTDEPFVYHYGPSYRVDGSGDSDMTSWKLDIGYNVEEIGAQSVLLDEAVVQARTIDAEVVSRFEATTRYLKTFFKGGVAPTTSVATGALDLSTEYGSSAGGDLRRLEFHVPLLSFRDDKLSELNPDGQTVMETLSGAALKGATHALWARLHNAHASAY